MQCCLIYRMNTFIRSEDREKTEEEECRLTCKKMERWREDGKGGVEVEYALNEHKTKPIPRLKRTACLSVCLPVGLSRTDGHSDMEDSVRQPRGDGEKDSWTDRWGQRDRRTT